MNKPIDKIKPTCLARTIISVISVLAIGYLAPIPSFAAHQGVTLPAYEVEFIIIKAKLKDVKVIDQDKPKRYSYDKLKMVSSEGGGRHAKAIANKEKPDLIWDAGEPEWTGLKNDVGKEEITNIWLSQAGTNVNTGTETAEAGGVSKTVTIEVWPPDIGKCPFAGDKTIQSISYFADRLAATFSISVGGDHKPFKIEPQWEWVDKYESPDIARKVNIKISGETKKFMVEQGIPAYSVDLPLIKLGLFLKADVKLVANLEYEFDPSGAPIYATRITGDISAPATIGARLYFLQFKGGATGWMLEDDTSGWEVTVKGDFDIPLELKYKWLDTVPTNPGMSSKFSVGPARVKLDIKVRMQDFTIKGVTKDWQIFGKLPIWEYAN